MGDKLTFDRTRQEIQKVTRSTASVLRAVLRYFLMSASLAIVYYIVFSMLIDTDSEEQLKKENQAYRQVYSEMQRKEQLISDVVDGLAVKDDGIFRKLFNSPAPRMADDGIDAVLVQSDTIEARTMVDYVAKKLDAIGTTASRIEANMAHVMDRISSAEASLPPLSSPVEDFSYAGAGASTGLRINPFYKVKVEHGGFDMIVPRGVRVCAASAGTVSAVRHSGKGLGNVVEIDHGNGWRTRYAHLEQMKVASGQKVSCGQMIGTVGVSGNSFAPHLHYEVLKDSLRCDPVHFFFASAGPADYMTMLYMSANAGQSMD